MERRGLSTGGTITLFVALAVVLVGCGILLGAYVIAPDGETPTAGPAVGQSVEEPVAREPAEEAVGAAVTIAALSDAAVKAAEADDEANAGSASAWLAYLQGVAALNQANRQIAIAAKQASKKQKIRRLRQAQALVRSVMIGARANEAVRNAQARARLKALVARATAVERAVRRVKRGLAGEAARSERAALQQLHGLKRSLGRSTRLLRRQLRLALRSGGREFQRAIRAIERQLRLPVDLSDVWGPEPDPTVPDSEG